MIPDNIFKVIFDDSMELKSMCNSLSHLVDDEPVSYGDHLYTFVKYLYNDTDADNECCRMELLDTDEVMVASGRFIKERITIDLSQKKIASLHDHDMIPCPFNSISDELINLRNHVAGQYSVRAYDVKGHIVQLLLHDRFTSYNDKITMETVDRSLTTIIVDGHSFTCLYRSDAFYVLVDGHQLMPVIDLKKEMCVPQFNEDV